MSTYKIINSDKQVIPVTPVTIIDSDTIIQHPSETFELDQKIAIKKTISSVVTQPERFAQIITLAEYRADRGINSYSGFGLDFDNTESWGYWGVVYAKKG